MPRPNHRPSSILFPCEQGWAAKQRTWMAINRHIYRLAKDEQNCLTVGPSEFGGGQRRHLRSTAATARGGQFLCRGPATSANSGTILGDMCMRVKVPESWEDLGSEKLNFNKWQALGPQGATPARRAQGTALLTGNCAPLRGWIPQVQNY